MKKYSVLLLSILSLIAGYVILSETGRMRSANDIYPRYVIGHLEQIGENSGKGNIIALSPYLHTYDFSSREAFSNMLHYYFDFAERRNLLNDSTIVVLPEYIGTWLVVAGEKKSVYKDTSIEDGLKTVVLSDIGKFGTAWIFSHSADKVKEAVFKMKSKKMLEIYQSVFSSLAREYGVTIVAGSIVLPEPSVQNGKMEIAYTGPLYNVSAVFDPGGRVQEPLTQKRFPVEAEKSFTAGAVDRQIPVYGTKAGNMAVLICADAWYPENYEFLSAKNVHLVAVPSFVSAADAWSRPWSGYNGAPTPRDVDKNDVGKMTEEEAWMRYAMCGRAKSTGIETGINVFLRGNLWNVGTDGHTLVYHRDSVLNTTAPSSQTGSMVNVWLE